MKSAEDLFELLVDIDKKKGRSFSGLGLVLYSNIDHLPMSSLKSIDNDVRLPLIPYKEVLNFLVKSAREESKFHDGFHLLNRNLELTHVAQYLAPKIIKTKLELGFGSRYRTAIYASRVSGIIATGVLSRNYPPTVFRNGKSLR